MHAGFFFEFAKRYRTQISHAVGMATNPRPRLVDVVPLEKRALKRGINRPYRCRHMRLRRTLETIGFAFESAKNHLLIDRFLLIERLKSFNIGNQSRAIASHRFHMHPPTSTRDGADSPSRMQNRKLTVSHQRKTGRKAYLLPRFSHDYS